MKSVAMTVAVIGFFGLALVGWLSGVPVFVCGMRALAGGLALYVLARLVGTLFVRMVADAAARGRAGEAEPRAGKERS